MLSPGHLIYYVVMSRLDDLSQTILLEGPEMNYYPVEWTEDNHIILRERYHFGDYYAYDLATGVMTPYLLPTPTTNP